MSTALLLTADVAAADDLTERLAQIRFRTRCVSSVQAAIDWLAMKEFSALLVDSRYGREAIVQALISGWKHHPLLAGCIFEFTGESQDQRDETLAFRSVGAQVFSGEDAISRMTLFLKGLPEVFAFAEKSQYAVLVVEDLDSPREIISSYIESLGFPTVDQASSVALALAMIEADPYRYFCVITDLRMPRESGLDLIKKVRHHTEELISALPVVVLTSVPSPENLFNCVKEGASGFLVKPPKKKQLRHELEKAKRISLMKQSPRLCPEEQTSSLEGSLGRLLGGSL